MNTLLDSLQRLIRRPFTAAMAIALLLAAQANAVVTPALDRAFCNNAAGANIIAQMQAETGNPLIAGTVMHFVNFSPADVTGDGAVDFEQ